MSIERLCDLSAEKSLALYLYAKERDKEHRGLQKSSVMIIINTGHPHSPKMNDIASDFDRYLQKDLLLAACFDAAREVLYGSKS
jgi:hypothetical protein